MTLINVAILSFETFDFQNAIYGARNRVSTAVADSAKPNNTCYLRYQTTESLATD